MVHLLRNRCNRMMPPHQPMLQGWQRGVADESISTLLLAGIVEPATGPPAAASGVQHDRRSPTIRQEPVLRANKRDQSARWFNHLRRGCLDRGDQSSVVVNLPDELGVLVFHGRIDRQALRVKLLKLPGEGSRSPEVADRNPPSFRTRKLGEAAHGIRKDRRNSQ